MYRYLAIIWDPRSLESAHTAHRLCTSLASEAAEWPIAHRGPGSLVVHTGERQGSREAYKLSNNSGVILGKLFNRDHHNCIAPQSIRFDDSETRRVVTSGGRHLLDHYWGSYVAFVYDESACTHHVLRDPVGTLPHYHTRHQDVDIFFYDIEDCVRFLPIRFEINRRVLTRWFFSPAVASRETCLENVEEPLAGECLSFSQGRMTRSLLWNPAEFSRTPRFEQLDEAASELRSTVQNAISAWASCYERIVHKLSGGLDSSIVAACLAQAPSKPDVTYLNYSSRVAPDQELLYLPGADQRTADRIRALTGPSDERYFARLVAERWKAPLIEQCGSNPTELSNLWRGPLKTTPAMYFAGMKVDEIKIGLVRTHGTQAFFSGEAGDSVFQVAFQPLSSIDYAYLHGADSDLWRYLMAGCNLSKESLWTVLLKTVKHGILRRPRATNLSFLTKPTFLKQEFVENLTGEDFQNTMELLISNARLPPGKQSHMKGLTASAYHHDVFHCGKYADHVDPLNSQPVWELMLSIPTYTVLTGGVSRGLARYAFADYLPAEIRKRQAKGTGSYSLQQLLRTNKSQWSEHLHNGLLAQEGYLDRQKLADCLAADEPFVKISPSHIAQCLAAEIWLQQWHDIRKSQVPHLSREVTGDVTSQAFSHSPAGTRSA